MTALSDRMVAALEAHGGVLAPAIRQLMAEAWTEGGNARSADLNRREDVMGAPWTPNPYAPEVKP